MKNNVKIFLVSGLGADKRTFNFLQLESAVQVTYVDWIKPLQREKIQSYCTRLIEKYKIDTNSILIGLSFGGLISIEISKQVNLLKTIIISSIRNKNDISLAFKISGMLGLHNMMTEKRIRKRNKFVEKAFGMESNEDKLVFSDVMKNTDIEIVKWGIREMINWKESGKNEEVIRIHGSKDKIFPLKGKVDYIIEDGGHMMIAQKAEEISNILNGEIKKLRNPDE